MRLGEDRNLLKSVYTERNQVLTLACMFSCTVPHLHVSEVQTMIKSTGSRVLAVVAIAALGLVVVAVVITMDHWWRRSRGVADQARQPFQRSAARDQSNTYLPPSSVIVADR